MAMTPASSTVRLGSPVTGEAAALWAGAAVVVFAGVEEVVFAGVDGVVLAGVDGVVLAGGDGVVSAGASVSSLAAAVFFATTQTGDRLLNVASIEGPSPLATISHS